MPPLTNKTNTQTTPYHQKDSLFNCISLELQEIIFEQILPNQLLKLSLVCKEWNDLAHDHNLWKILGKKIGLNNFSSDPTNDYRCGLAFFKLNFKQNFEDVVFAKLEKLETWKDTLDFKCREGSFESGVNNVSQLTSWQSIYDYKNHFGKKIVGNELVLVFVTANRWNSKIIRFNLSFNLESASNEYLLWKYDIESASGFFLSEKAIKYKKDFELSCVWKTLNQQFNSLMRLFK